MRLTHGRNGEILSYGQIVNNIKTAENSTPTVLRELYGAGEWDSVKRLATALEPLTLRGPDGNITGGGRGIRNFMQMLERSPTARTIVSFPGVRTAVDMLQRARDGAAASAATSGGFVRPAATSGGSPLLAPASAAAGSNYQSGNRPPPTR
jgi:hypothetical protein